MRLINTATLELESFFGNTIPSYAILSHRWEDSEVTFQDMQDGKAEDMRGFAKIKGCCNQAALDGWEYAWIDSCCIDKSSSAELSEAINSMFQWYQKAEVCYVYLSDVGELKAGFEYSQWFTRGWTLQELLAPEYVEFFDRKWVEIGTKVSLAGMLERITGITHLFNSHEASAAQKLSWTSKRKTTRVEDQAYSLMGLFGVHMAPLYGEGGNAFIRLQLEILAKTDDESIFAWTSSSSQLKGLLADSSFNFINSGNVVRKTLDPERPPSVMTSKGLRLEMLMKRENQDSLLSTPRFLVPLNCMNGETLQPIALTLDGWGSTLERRPGLTLLDKYWLKETAEGIHRRLIFVKQNFSVPLQSKNPPSWRPYVIHVGIQFEPLVAAGFSIGHAWCQGPRLDLKQTRSSIEYYMPLNSWDDVDNFSKNPVSSISFHKGAEILVIVLGFCTVHTRGGLWVDQVYNTLVNDTPQSLGDIGRKLCEKWKGKIGPDRVPLGLLDGTMLSLSLKRQKASHRLKHMIYVSLKFPKPGPGRLSAGQKHLHPKPLSTLLNDPESKPGDVLQSGKKTEDDN